MGGKDGMYDNDDAAEWALALHTAWALQDVVGDGNLKVGRSTCVCVSLWSLNQQTLGWIAVLI